MKQLSRLALGLVFVLGSTACGDDDASAADGGPEAGEGGAGTIGRGGSGGTGDGGTTAARGGGAGASGSAGAAGRGGAGASGSGGAAGRGGTAGASGSAGAAGRGGGGGSGGAAGASGRWVAGYYVGYQRQLYTPEQIDWGALTHLMIGRVIPRSDGTLATHYDIDEVNGPILAKRLVDLAHQNDRKAIAMIGGAGEHAGFVGAASAANRAKFVQNLVALAEDVGYDGFDIDWEPVEEADQPNLLALVMALRQANSDFILTFPLNWVNANFPAVPDFYAELATHLDQLNLMTYAMSAAWSGWQSWHSSALTGHGGTTPSSVESSAEAYLEAGVPAHKLGVGIGFYGVCWTPPVSEPRQDIAGAQLASADNDMSFTNIMRDYHSASARKWDDAAAVPYLSFDTATGPRGCGFVSYEDAESIRAKAAWVKERGLGGTIIWTINQGYLPDAPEGQRDPLMQALRDFL